MKNELDMENTNDLDIERYQKHLKKNLHKDTQMLPERYDANGLFSKKSAEWFAWA